MRPKKYPYSTNRKAVRETTISEVSAQFLADVMKEINKKDPAAVAAVAELWKAFDCIRWG
ncbi:hypothetical protein [Streptococcus intermedius]|uniref:hypothetical protein n=1 Tax=Streptococcus intermedius TaxID=1338 RepID=UPI000F67AD06|nr:hypothetical protein [Streptococcus intermedius]RSJ13904.1 hypothetical protein D8832_03140 [Streptococcus intermedius]